MDKMKAGEVKTADLLPIVSRLMNELSAGGIEQARRSSGAEQMRAENALLGRGGLLDIFSKSGGESGFARFWRGVNSQLEHSKPLAEGYARAFEFSATQMQKLLTWTESFNNAIEGKDSQVADWLGADATAQLRTDWEEIKRLVSDISNSGGPPWLQPMEVATTRIAQALGLISRVSRWRSETPSALSSAYDEQGIFSAGWLGLKQAGSAISSGFGRLGQTVLEAHPTAKYLPVYDAFQGAFQGMTEFDPTANYWKERGTRLGYNSLSMQDAQGALQNGSSLTSPSQDDALTALLLQGRGGTNQQQVTYQNQVELNVTVQGGQEAEDWARNTFTRLIEESLTHFPSR